MREQIKKRIKDAKIEPYVRWFIKRSRGIKMPFDLVKNEIYDRQAAEVMQRILNSHSNCIDVGCHQGQFLRDYLKYAAQGQHFAFEPIPYLAAKLKDAFPSVQVFPYALSDSAGDTTFYVIPDSPTLSGLNARGFLAPDKVREEIQVHMERLDNLIPTDVKIDLIKIDVEGAEGPVIQGALDTIRRNRPYLILEHGGQSSAAFGYTSGQIYDLLVNTCGLQVSLLAQWLKAGDTLTREQFLNCGEWYFLAHPPR
jgi:FkbM family methyltransferase